MDCCVDCMAFEFQPENVAPYHEDLRLFVRPQVDSDEQDDQWSVNWLSFVVYRIVVATLISVWVIVDFLDEAYHFYSDNYAIWFVFATNWSFLLLAVSAVMRAVWATYHFVQARYYDPNNESESPRPATVGIMAVWIVYNMAANGAIVVTFSYWTFLAAFDNSGFLATHMSQLKHSLNSAYILVDIMISAVPIRIFHLIYPMFVGATYTVFNALYFINNGVGPDGNPYAYYVMDWRNPIESAVTCSLGFIMTTIVQCLLYGLYRLRLNLYSRWLCGRETPPGLPVTSSPRVTNGGAASAEVNATQAEVQGILSKTPKRHSSHDQRASYSSVEQMEMTSPANANSSHDLDLEAGVEAS